MKRPLTRTSRSWRDAGSWARLLSGHEGSGLSVKEYCAAQGVSAASYYRWQNRLKQEEGMGFSPIEIEAKPVGSIVVEVELPGGVSLRFSELPPAAYLRSLSSSFSQ
ncbi:MAG: hypothetical protein H6566_08845 [Lewinellaceae bacterium]|nr:hypothetical protein [Lewinellaceae bacterium]